MEGETEMKSAMNDFVMWAPYEIKSDMEVPTNNETFDVICVRSRN